MNDFSSDKNLGPVIMERETYIKRALSDHLLNDTNYKQLTYHEATNAITTTRGQGSSCNTIRFLLNKNTNTCANP